MRSRDEGLSQARRLRVIFGLGRAQLRGPLYLDEPTSFTPPESLALPNKNPGFESLTHLGLWI
jgi:hypothetical protein